MNFARILLSQIEEAGAYDARGERPRPKSSLATLVASIREHGLLQPPLVRKIAINASGEGTRYRIVAGNRRFAALRQIHGKKDVEVPVMIAADAEGTDARAFEASLAENIVREPMHPVDEHDAYARLIVDGLAPQEIAKRFGVKESWVRQRLQLARLAPDLRDLWRNGKMTADQAEALSTTDGPEIQRAAWADASKNGDWYLKPSNIRNAVRSRLNGVLVTDLLVKFIGGFEVYLAAGGKTEQDLFSAEINLIDAELLALLEAQTLQVEVDKLLAEGWAFARTSGEINGQFAQLVWRPFATGEELAAVAKDKRKEWTTEQEVRKRMESDPEARRRSGCNVSRAGADVWVQKLIVNAVEAAEGEPHTSQYGDDEEEAGDDNGHGNTHTAEQGGDPSPPNDHNEEQAGKVNHALCESLSETLTRALAETLPGDPIVGAAALLATLEIALVSHMVVGPLRLSVNGAWEFLAPRKNLAAAHDWTNKFKENIALDRLGLLKGFAKVAGALLDLRVVRNDSRHDQFDGARPELIAALASETRAGALVEALDKHFDRSAYFARLTKTELQAALTEMGVGGKRPQSRSGLATLATATAKAQGWLPEELRLPGLAALPILAKSAE